MGHRDGDRPLHPPGRGRHRDLLGAHVILATPRGPGSRSWRSAHTTRPWQRTARASPAAATTRPRSRRWSAKFFALVAVFGSANVGMMTGDSSVNPTAPIICCTAEILANIALRDGADADVAQVVMDEFHYYADPQRGWAWQVPLLELPQAQFVLMSATLGDTTTFTEDLETRTGRTVAEVTSAERPVPLTFAYVVEPLNEVLEELVTTHRAPSTSCTSRRRTPSTAPRPC
ncbi:hypothetical protein NKG05_03270 [Oerskovia sp. M15]